MNYSARLDRLNQGLQSAGLDALLVTYLPNIYYLSGFTGSTATLLVTGARRWFITDFRYHEQFAQQVGGGYELVDNTSKKLIEELLPQLAGSELRRIGFESDRLPHAQFVKLQALPELSFEPTTLLVDNLRLIKDAEELARLRAAVALNERIFTELRGLIGPETREADLAAEIEYRARHYGAEAASFSPIIASGVNSAKPHAGFTAGKLVPGTPLTIDMGVRLDGYCSDMTRTVFFRDCPPQWEKVYAIVREAKRLAAAAIRPGVTGAAVDAAARLHIADAGHGEHFGHGLGHGVGIEVHEGPRLARTVETALAPGHIVTNEPGIYLPGEGGIRIEDMHLVTADGNENLNRLPDELLVVG
jgi:Xaa-Pro aminopeptidase